MQPYIGEIAKFNNYMKDAFSKIKNETVSIAQSLKNDLSKLDLPLNKTICRFDSNQLPSAYYSRFIQNASFHNDFFTNFTESQIIGKYTKIVIIQSPIGEIAKFNNYMKDGFSKIKNETVQIYDKYAPITNKIIDISHRHGKNFIESDLCPSAIKFGIKSFKYFSKEGDQIIKDFHELKTALLTLDKPPDNAISTLNKAEYNVVSTLSKPEDNEVSPLNKPSSKPKDNAVSTLNKPGDNAISTLNKSEEDNIASTLNEPEYQI